MFFPGIRLQRSKIRSQKATRPLSWLAGKVPHIFFQVTTSRYRRYESSTTPLIMSNKSKRYALPLRSIVPFLAAGGSAASLLCVLFLITSSTMRIATSSGRSLVSSSSSSPSLSYNTTSDDKKNHNDIRQEEPNPPLPLLTCQDGKHGQRCHALIVVQSINATFCTAAKVASTSIRSYFMSASGGSVVAPKGSKYPSHQANWTRLNNVSPEMQHRLTSMNTTKQLGTASISSKNHQWQQQQEWVQVFFVRNVVERFLSGYLDKIVNDCSRIVGESVMYHKLEPHGFSCEKHTDLEAFIYFLEKNIHHVDGHFKPQTFFCEPHNHTYTDVIVVNEELNQKLKGLSAKLGIHYVAPNEKVTRAHKTGSGSKIVDLFTGRKDLLLKVLDMYKEDCLYMPSLCNVTDLMSQIEVAP